VGKGAKLSIPILGVLGVLEGGKGANNATRWRSYVPLERTNTYGGFLP
jgi:hypothetical protein